MHIHPLDTPRRKAPFHCLHRGVIILLLFLLSFPVSCNRSGKNPEKEGNSAGKDLLDESVPVKTVLPQSGNIALYLHATTSILAKNKADVYARTAGFCERVLAEEGDAVRKGFLLAKLGDREIQLALDQSTARLNKGKKDYERAKSLLAEGLISRQMHQDLFLQLSLARADSELARKRLADTSIAASISGVITNRSVKVGDLVTTTQPLFKIEDLELLEAEIHIPEQDFLKVKSDQEAELLVDAFPDKLFRGSVERVNPVIDSQSGTAEATVAILNPEGLLRPGMFVRVRVVTDIHQDTLIIPKEAVLIQGDRKAVYVVRDGAAREVFVRTGFQDADRVEILEGLTPEDPVIVMGHLGLQGETKVRIIK
jgi:membrane fusion protein (multidrug efflux system)